MQRLNIELDEERRKKAKQKMLEREAAKKVIQDNILEKQKQMKAQELAKKQDAEEIKQIMQRQKEEQERRERETRERGERIQKKMDSMADVVKGDADKQAMKAAEREYIQQCIEKDERAKL